MKIHSEEFRVPPGKEFKLADRATIVKPFYQSKKQYKEILQEHVEELSTLQQLHYASNRYALLLIFQGMDSAGKDGAIKHVMSGVNPKGCQVFSFKRPSAEELEHDFLWRTTRDLPERGRIGIFNRSYYEEVLVAKVHPDVLKEQAIPQELVDDPRFWDKRYHSINELEKHLYRNGTRIIKFFLHLSKEEQRRRFLRRVEDPKRSWKFSRFDLVERSYWKEYQDAYEACLSATSAEHAPWFVVPADDKLNARLIISQVVSDALRDLKMEFPMPDQRRLKELKKLGKLLAK